MLNTIPGMLLVYKLVPATPPVGATLPLPPTFKLRHYSCWSGKLQELM
jgi:hypothetical protein